MAKRVKKPRVPRTRNNETMTEAAFWSWIRSALRMKSRWWKPIAEAKKRARRPYKGPNKRRKWEFKCAECKQYFPEKEINVDHIIPAGTLKSSDDLKGFVDRLFCEVDGLQVLCTTCHDKKTALERKNNNMKVIVTKEDKMSEILENISSVVNNKFYYIPGWFEKDDNGDFQFHHMNNLPEELKQAVEKLQKPLKKEK